MAIKSFVTSMPDKAGAFLRASSLIASLGGNIVRVSYNKAVDLHMLFIDIEASEEKLKDIEKSLLDIGYINKKITETRVIEVVIKIPDRPGAVLPVLEVFDKHEINISYLNSSAEDGVYQDFKFGLLIENPGMVKTLLDEISDIYQIDIVQCDAHEEKLDNTVFYIRLANEMQKLLGLDTEKTMQFITESNRILQALQTEGEDAGKVFQYIRRFAYFVSENRGNNFKASIERFDISHGVTLYSIQPRCGSNTYVFDSPNELTFIDTGYAIFSDEMKQVFKSITPDFETRHKKIYITHADVDHCGLLSKFEDAEIIMNKKSAESLKRQMTRLPDYRENTGLRMGYSRISQIISGYVPPRTDRFEILDRDTPEQHDGLLTIGDIMIGTLKFTVYEGSGGHLGGEMVYVCKDPGIVFTGDLLVNIEGFSKETAEFNSFAPYLMKSVNVDSPKALEMRKQVIRLIQHISDSNHKPCMICCGHGVVSKLEGSKIIAYTE